MRSLALSLVLSLACLGQTVSVYVTGPQVRITSGDTMQLTAIARNNAGEPVTSAGFQWSSSDSKVLQVDSSGNITAGSLGLADITVAVGNVRGLLRIQVLPQRIEIAPPDANIMFGSQQQFTATAYNSRNQPIPDAILAWHVLVMAGYDSSTVPIRNGLVTASTLGYYRVRASVVYPYSTDQFQREFDGSTGLTINPGDYKLTSMISNDYARPAFGLRGRRGNIAANDSGAVIFSGVLDGLSNGLFQIQSGQITPIATAGAPSLLPGVVAFDFDEPSIDSSGNVLARMANLGSGNMAVLFTSSGEAQLIAADNYAAGIGLDLNGIFSNRFSLSESGDAVIRANFHYDGSTDYQQGLFRYYAGDGLYLETAATDPLPGITGRVTFDDQFGVDGDGVIYFITSTPSRALYRRARGGQPVRMLGLNDALNGSTVTGINQLAVSSGGDAVLYVSLASGAGSVAVFRKSAPPQVFNLPYISTLFAINSTGTIAFSGDGGSGYGLYSWNPTKGGSAQPILLRNRPMPGGEPAFDFYSAAIDSTGRVFAAARGVITPWLLITAFPTPSILVTAGDTLGVTANLNISTNLVTGDRTGPLHLIAGGNQASILRSDAHGLTPVLIINDKLPGGSLYTGNYPVRKSASGDLYVTTDQASYRLNASSTTQLISYPVQTSDAVSVYSPYNTAVNDNKQLAFIGGTSRNHQRIMFSDGNGAPNTIAYFAGTAPYQTPVSSGGFFTTLSDLSLNEDGVVMVLAQTSAGQSGLFLYDGSAWQPSCILQTCQLGGETITTVSGLRSAGHRFCAIFNTRLGNPRIDCWEAGAWVNIAKRGDFTSDGTELNAIGAMDVNRNGDVAFVGYTGVGGPSVFLKRAPDRFLTVYAVQFPLGEGETFRSIYSIDLRDNGRLYFIGMDFSDRLRVYEALPNS